MSFIEDGKGKGTKMAVSANNRGDVSARSNPRIYYVSRDQGEAFSFLSEYSATSGDTVLYIRNDSADKHLVVSGIWVSGVEAGSWHFAKVTGTPTGTDLVSNVLNFSKPVTASVSAKGNGAVTGTSLAYNFAHVRTLANGGGAVDFKEALILGRTDAIVITYTGTDGDITATVGCYLEEI